MTLTPEEFARKVEQEFIPLIAQQASLVGMNTQARAFGKFEYEIDFTGFHPKIGPIRRVFTVWYNALEQQANYMEGMFRRYEKAIN